MTVPLAMEIKSVRNRHPELADDALIELKRLRIDADVTYLRFLLADYRCQRARKDGFNPDQPRDDHGRWTSSGAGDGASDSEYSPDKPGWHDYTAGPNLVCTVEQTCSAREIADQLSRFAVPGQDPAVPAKNGNPYPVHDPIAGIFVGNVDTRISDDGLTVENRTKNDHILYDGKITRSASQNPDGSWSVTTHGIGNNVIEGMNTANQFGGPVIFDILDARMRDNIRLYHGTGKSLDDRDFSPARRAVSRDFAVGTCQGAPRALSTFPGGHAQSAAIGHRHL